MRSISIVLLAAVSILAEPHAVRAQSDWVVEVIPRLGLVAPDSYFYEVFANFVGDGPVEWTTGSLGRAFVAGLGVEVDVGETGVRFRAEVLRSFDSWLLAGHNFIIPRVIFQAPQLVTTWLDIPYTVTMTSVQAVLPLRLAGWGLEPYVLAGVGGKFYAFSEPRLPNEVGATLPSDGFTWGGDLGAGVTVPLFGLTFDVQARDAINRYWDKTQHDLVYSGALKWRVR